MSSGANNFFLKRKMSEMSSLHDFFTESQRWGKSYLTFICGMFILGCIVCIALSTNFFIENSKLKTSDVTVKSSRRAFDMKHCETEISDFVIPNASYVHMCEYPEDPGSIVQVEYNEDKPKVLNPVGSQRQKAIIFLILGLIAGGMGLFYIFWLRSNPFIQSMAGVSYGGKVSTPI